MARRQVKDISYYEITGGFFTPTRWRCHVYADDGSHYQGEGYSKEEAKQIALDILRAND